MIDPIEKISYKQAANYAAFEQAEVADELRTLNPPHEDPASDFIFGDLPSAQIYQARQQALAMGLVHRNRLEPKRVLPAQPFKLTVSVGKGVRLDSIKVFYTTDGSIPTPDNSRSVDFKYICTEWSDATWDYLQYWQAELPAQPVHTLVRYQIVGLDELTGHRHSADSLPAEVGLETTPTDGPYFSVWVGPDAVPAWIWDAVIYHIFLDRFYPGDDKTWLVPQPPANFMGGTLRGVIDKLPYLHTLGVNCLWLSPIFPSPSYHRYDSTDWLEVDPRLGTKADLHELVDKAHALGLRVLLDFVPNHTSHLHPNFQEALARQDSSYYGWYTFREWPQRYKGFFDLPTLPEINNDFAPARQATLDAARYWQREFGIDGYRLDYASGPSLDFWTAYRKMMQTEFPQNFSVGEITEGAEILSLYQNRLDGCLDFSYALKIRKLLAFDGKVSEFVGFLERQQQFFNLTDGFVLPTFLDNHDMARFLWMAGNDKRRLKLAALCQLTWPQPAIIYYGTEVGLSMLKSARKPDGGIEHAQARLPMPWNAEEGQDLEMLAYYQKIIALRHEHQILRRGRWIAVYADDTNGVMAYALLPSKSDQPPTTAALVILNTYDQPLELKLRLTHSDLPQGNWHSPLSGGAFKDGASIKLAGLAGDLFILTSDNQ